MAMRDIFLQAIQISPASVNKLLFLLIVIFMLLLTEGQEGEACNLRNKAKLFRQSGVLEA
jgi:hypothetical protein